MPKFNWKLILPHIAAVALFLVLIFAYFPELLDGKTLRMDDIEQHKGMSNELSNYREKTGEEALWTNAMFGGMPGYIISVVYHGNLMGYGAAIMKLGLPRPADSMFVLMLGMYVLLLIMKVRQPLAVIGSVAYCFTSYNLLIMEAGHMSKVDAISWMPWVLAGIILAFRGKYLWGGLLTAIFLSIQIKASHFQVTYYMSFILIFFGIFFLVEAIRTKQIPGFLKSAGVLVIAAIFGFLTNSSSLLTIYDYGKDSIRGKSELTIKEKPDGDGLDADYALQYSYGKGETFSYLIPNVYGGASNISLSDQKSIVDEASAEYKNVIKSLPQYWWDTSTTGPFYAGAAICFLAVLGFLFVEGPYKWAILASCIFAILLSWGKNFEGFSVFMLENFPGYNKFRAVKMILIIVDFLLPLMAILGLNEIVKQPDRVTSEKAKFFGAFALTGGLAIVFYILPDTFFSFDYLNPAIGEQINAMLAQAGYDKAAMDTWLNGFMVELEDVRMAIFKADAFRAFIICAVVAAVIFLYSKRKFNVILLTAVLLIITVADLWSIDKRYVNKKDFIPKSKLEVPFSPSPADEAVYALELRSNPALKPQIDKLVSEAVVRNKEAGRRNDEAKNRFRALLSLTDYRVLNIASNVFNDAGTSFFHKSVGGYSAAKLERYQEFIEYHLQPSIESLFSVFRNAPSDSSIQAMLSRQYALNMLNTKYIIYNEKAAPLINQNALGNAWFVDEIKEVDSADKEILEMTPSFDPGVTAIVDKRFHDAWSGVKNGLHADGEITLSSYEPNYLVYEAQSKNGGVAVFSEIYYEKGWKGYIDGKEMPHFRANYILRAMKIPAGKYKIEFKFEPELYASTETISMASSGLLILLLFLLIALELRKKKPAQTSEA
ncbi:MAG: YfhO family protein [Bacteroidia bacterium]